MSGVDDSANVPVPDGSRPVASRLRILRALRQAPRGLRVQELSESVGRHTNTVRFHLDRLVAEGMVTRHVEERTEPGRPRLTFTAVAGPAAHEDQRSYRLLAEILTGFVAESVPDARAASTEAGRVWGHYLTERPGPFRRTTEEQSLAELVRILEAVGFAPELAGGDGRWELWFAHCPFLEAAVEHREVVCAVHLGLMRGALAEMRSPITADRLEPFVEPSLCMAGLSEADADRAHRPGRLRGHSS